MSIDDIISKVIKNEVLPGSTDGSPTNDPADLGGRTQFGISEKANPEAWLDNKVTEEEAREIYKRKYVFGPKFDKILDTGLRAQLVDWGVNSGPAIAIQALQRILKVTVDGVLGPETFHALEQKNAILVNNALLKERILMLCRVVQKNPSQLKFLTGLVSRSLEFIA